MAAVLVRISNATLAPMVTAGLRSSWKSPWVVRSMRRRNAPPLDDHDHRRSDTYRRHFLELHRTLKGLGMRRRGGKILVVRTTQGAHMVSDDQNEFIPKLGQCTDLHAVAGAAQQLQGVIRRALISVFNPFNGSQADKPARP